MTTENLGRKITITVVLSVAAILCLIVPKKPFRLGLDLQGGTRVVCRFDMAEAFKQGKISAQENSDRPQLLQDICAILRGRIDPHGVLDPVIRPEGSDRIVIEIPGAAELATTPVQGQLAAAIDTAIDSLTLAPMEVELLKQFPPTGADIQIDKEKLSYSSRHGSVLSGLQRGIEGTDKAAHDASARIDLLTSDEIVKAIVSTGDMQFLLGAEAQDFTRLGSDQTKETQKVQDWVKANPGRPIEEYNRLAPDKGGPVPGLVWFPQRIGKDEPETPMETRLRALVGTGNDKWNFTGNDLAAVSPQADEYGQPAVHFEINTEKKNEFTEFTRTNIKRGMGIVLNGEIVTLATINSTLPGSGIITGGARGFLLKEVKDMVSVLKSGSLVIKPVIENKTRVGATLGDEYVWKGFLSSLAALGVIVVFMLYFYHRLGLLSVIGLVLNLLLLMGAMAFLQATLTLPGVAGVILTLGMAVDGNILIYERLREELGRGLKPPQAVKQAFERANVTIIDAHVTQLIASLILYFAGTGPIRGFATTLSVGILTTLFTVIVVTEVLVVTDIRRGTANLGMKKVLVNPKWPFMKHANYVIVASSVLVILGLGLFISLPEQDKYGTDFTGGFSMTVKTEEPQPITRMREMVATIPGTIGRSSSVVPVLESGDRQAGYTKFRITYKLQGTEAPEGQAGEKAESKGETSIKQVQGALATVLEKGPLELELTDEGTKVKGRLHFEDKHSEADLVNILGVLGLKQASATPAPDKRFVYDVSGVLEEKLSVAALSAKLESGLKAKKDSAGVFYHLSNSVPESDFIGPQVGGELRDKAVLAVLLSLAGTLMYLRIRFAEYAYGIAVVVSLVHDVLIAIGGLAVAIKLELLQAEIDLSMIAAFLTIIGYSQNDTIVIFDRVRENRRKSNKPLRQILDDSISECFGRTILTTATVVLTLLVLFVFNVGSRNVLEGFSYCLLVGVISGAYSTIYIASPVLLWLENYAAKKAAKGGGGGGAAQVEKKEPVAV